MDGTLLWSRRGYRPIDGSHFIEWHEMPFEISHIVPPSNCEYRIVNADLKNISLDNEFKEFKSSFPFDIRSEAINAIRDKYGIVDIYGKHDIVWLNTDIKLGIVIEDFFNISYDKIVSFRTVEELKERLSRDEA